MCFILLSLVVLERAFCEILTGAVRIELYALCFRSLPAGVCKIHTFVQYLGLFCKQLSIYYSCLGVKLYFFFCLSEVSSCKLNYLRLYISWQNSLLSFKTFYFTLFIITAFRHFLPVYSPFHPCLVSISCVSLFYMKQTR